MSNTIIDIQSISKRFNKTQALDNVSLHVDQGDIFCLLGPNGSGKTTMINCMLELLRADKGLIKIFDKSTPDIPKQKIGVLLEEDGFFRDLSAEKNLKIACRIKNVDYEVIPGLLEKVSLFEHRKKRVKKLSQGMRKRLAMAYSLIGDPDLLIWDEPYNSLDPTGFKFMRNLIADLHQQGKTFFISTHMLDEVKKTATHIGLIHNGVFQELNTVEQAIKKYGSVEAFYFTHVSPGHSNDML